MIVTKIDEKIEQYSLLKHPFYQAWSAGTLTQESLRGYVKEYFHLVKAVPTMVEKIYAATPTEEIKRNLEEEKSHVALWEQFAVGMGVSLEELHGYTPSDKTVEAVNKMVALMENSVDGAAAMYAYEAEIPNISRSKLDGLKAFYGVDDAKTVEYFNEHEIADVYHREVWKSLMSEFSEKDQSLALTSAIECLKAQNRVLDAVCDKYLTPAMC
ncbi:MAG TPA: iron-containing redox enzyme family protein [Bacteroidia bacterium]|jgi:pyrroloquinoline-quinone synthase|nr:iron-containing redox enzyme family protein [Bacteroidia bacterium]